MANKKTKKRSVASKSMLLTLIQQGLGKLGNRFADSSVIRFFTGYDQMEEYAESSLTVGGIQRVVETLKKKFARKPRRERGTEQITPKEVGIFVPGSLPRSLKNRVSEAMEDSVILAKTEAFLRKMRYMPMMHYGVFLFSFGLFTTVVQAILYFWRRSNNTSAALDLFVGLTVVLLSLLVMFKGYEPLMESLRESIAGRFMIRMLDDCTITDLPRQKHHSAGMFFIAGLIMGGLTLVAPPLTLIGIVLMIVLMICVCFVPEAGICALLFALPFLFAFSIPVELSAIAILYIGVCMLFKTMVGKRSITIDFMDGWLLLFGIVVLSTGYSADQATLDSALLYASMISGYFILSNLLRSKLWISRCLNSIVLSAFVVSVVGIANHFMNLGVVFMSEGAERTAVHYLLITIPITLVCVICSDKYKTRVSVSIALVAQLTYLVLLGSYTGVIAAVAELVFFFLFYTRKIWNVFLFTIPVLLVVSYWFDPDVWVLWGRASTGERGVLWKGLGQVFKSAPLSGIGMNDGVLYRALHEYVGNQDISLSQTNTFMRILVQVGIPGVLLFAVFIVLWYVAGFTLIRRCGSKERNTALHLGFMASMTGFLMAGNLAYVWNDPRLLLFFWMCAGLARAIRRLAKPQYDEEELGGSFVRKDGVQCVDVDLIFTKSSERESIVNVVGYNDERTTLG